MATTSPLPLILLLSLLSATASARPCKTLFYFTATTTTTTYYPYNSLPHNPNPYSHTPHHLTLFFTSTTRFPNRHPTNFDSNPSLDDDSDLSEMLTSSDFPLKFYSSVSSSIRDRTKDILSVVGALLFGVGCGALTAATMYFVWALFSPRRFDLDDGSSSSDDDDDDDEVIASKKKLGYFAIPTSPKVVDDDLKKPSPPVKEAV